MASPERPIVDPDLLEILACPKSHQPLALADGALLERINRAIRAGTCRNVGGALLDSPLEHALVRKDGTVAYPIRERIPVLLVDEGIPVPA